ncbi:MAG: hypothetical protein UV40_C0012G0005 [Parcubacteria group bacterium GW2011_GWA1_42_7]|nr:MAG: hypothetical protein UV34_C0005G0011 [Parcubacteria group bacterium GW2011_GWB1_42_6]KKS69884.1 MAG: hypothetical protein UV40_C0012G0005 [Parcubacteria group bacterium GW2011_GWA1_42_7]KKS92255.1 MAG: hypothetical protein UV67_C0007G0021 [Parcubacteria group bacterium GW2011_GWC1_43_12]
MKNKILFLLAITLVFLPVMARNSRASGASLSLISGGTEYKVGEKLKLVIFLDPNGQNADTVRVNLKYPAQFLKIQSFYKNTNFTISAPGNDFNNETGDFTFGAGIPSGINQSGPFGYIDFTVEKAGQGTISIGADSLVLGAGQNLFDGQASSIDFDFKENYPSPSPQTIVQSPPPQASAAAQAAIKTPKPSLSPLSNQKINPQSITNLNPSQEPGAETVQTQDESRNQSVLAVQNSNAKNKIDAVWMIMTLIIIAGVIVYSLAVSGETAAAAINEKEIKL